MTAETSVVAEHGVAEQAAAPARRFGWPGMVVAAAGIVLALWVSLGRVPFGVAGELTALYVITLGFGIGTLHFFAGKGMVRTARLGRRTRPATVVMVVFSWATGTLLGLTLPDVTPIGLQTILSGAVEPGLGIAVGVANPAGIICIATAIAAVALASVDARVRPRGHDDHLD